MGGGLTIYGIGMRSSVEVTWRCLRAPSVTALLQTQVLTAKGGRESGNGIATAEEEFIAKPPPCSEGRIVYFGGVTYQLFGYIRQTAGFC